MQRQVHLKEVKRLIHESNNVVTDERKMCLKIKDANSVFNNLFHFGLALFLLVLLFDLYAIGHRVPL